MGLLDFMSPSFNPMANKPQGANQQAGLLGLSRPDLLNMGMGILNANQKRIGVGSPNLFGAGLQQMQAGREQRQQQDFRQQEFDMRKAEHDYKMNQPQQRKIIKGNDGFNYYENGERVLPGVQAKPQNRNLVKAIDPNTGQPKYMYEDEAHGMTPYSKALVENNIGGKELPYKIPNGFMLKDQNDPSQGVVPIPGSGKDASPPEQAGKTQMLRTAKNALSSVEGLLFNDDGTINDLNVVNASTNTPYTSGRRMRAYMEQGIQAITRAETGAAMPATEIENTRIRFQPSPLDDEATKIAKYDMFKEFVSGSLSLIDPSGRFQEDRFNRELKSRGGNPTPESEIKKEQKKEDSNDINSLIDMYSK